MRLPHSEDHSTLQGGLKLKRARLRLKLTYRDVERASRQISDLRGNQEFTIAISRLADIENKGTLPSMHRIYTLCAVYRLDPDEVLKWYGIPRDLLSADALAIRLDETHPIRFSARGTGAAPIPADVTIDLTETTFLSQVVRRWGTLPLHLLNALDFRKHRYGLIGQEDWSMYPLLHPGSLVLIDDRKRKIAPGGWTNEFQRPIYFLEHRAGNCCGWCDVEEGRLIVHAHPASHQKSRIFAYPAEIDVIGQITGVAMIFAQHPHRPDSGEAVP